MKLTGALIICLFGIFSTYAQNNCEAIHKVTVCHKEENKICLDISSLYGHFTQYSMDSLGTCQVSVEDKIKVWPCNFGLKHPIHNDSLCTRVSKPLQLCRPSEICLQDQNSNCDCVCSNTQSQVENLSNFDFIEGEISNFSLLNSAFSYSGFTIKAGASTFNQASTDQGQEIINKEHAVQLHLASERFGASYFTDMCFAITDPILFDYELEIESSVELTEETFQGGAGYSQSAMLTQRSALFCDTNGQTGPFQYRNSPSAVSSELPFNGGSRSFTNIVKGARSCFVRSVFMENQKQYLRPWNDKMISVQSTLVVTPNEEIRSDSSIRYCEVFKINDNLYKCTQRDFSNTEAFKAFMLTNFSNSSDWHKKNALNYIGNCRTSCFQ